LPVRVTAPPELISTNFETVALMVTVPVVDCPRQVTVETMSEIESSGSNLIRRGIFGSFE